MTVLVPQPSDPLAAALRACPDDHDLWDMFRAREFPGERVNLNPGTLGTPSRSVRAARRAFDDADGGAWPLGQYKRARADLRRARARARDLWGPAPLALTGGASEAMTRLTLALHARLAPGPIRVLTSAHEHAGGLHGFLHHPGFSLHHLPDAALADPHAVAAAARELRPHVLFLSQITYTIGQVLPVSSIVAAVRAVLPDLWIIVDAAQAVGLVAPALAGADATVASGHKWLFGPPGGGLVWLSERARHELAPGQAGEPLDPDAPCAAFERAGGHDFSVHAGTAAALELHAALGPEVVLARSRALARWFAAELHARLSDLRIDHWFFDPVTGALVDTPPAALLAAVHVHFPALDPYPAYAALDARGVHLKCIKSTRPNGGDLAVLRAGLPCYESHSRLRRALDQLAAALAGAP
jgi:UDP-sulfoquinovose synthase